MVAVTERGVTFEAGEVQKSVGMLYQTIQRATQGLVDPGSIISKEEYLKRLCNHYRSMFPLSSVVVCAVEHRISGEYYHIRHEQRSTVFGHTRRTDVYIIGRQLGTVFTILGDGGYKNWRYSGWFERNGTTLKFL
ncbi:hypothetical protein V1511DRAFT_507576 [Dipodascopsis uninucleata]